MEELLNYILNNKEELIKLSENNDRVKKILYQANKLNDDLEVYGKKAKVKESSNLIYSGKTFPLLGVYIKYNNGNGEGIYADGTRELIIDLSGTSFEDEHGISRTVINEKELEIIE